MTGKKPSRAVTEARAPRPGGEAWDDQIEKPKELTPEQKRWLELGWFATPPWGTRSGAELLKKIDPEAKIIMDPAAGDGIMAECLREYFPNVIAGDIEPQKPGIEKRDFLSYEQHPDYEILDWVFTNPPFHLAEEFVRIGMMIAQRGVAVLCRMSILGGRDRFPMLFGGKPGLKVFSPFTQRVGMQLGPWNPSCSTATEYAWLFFSKPCVDIFGLRTSPLYPIIVPIPPGSKERLTKPDDIRRFCKPKEGTLL